MSDPNEEKSRAAIVPKMPEEDTVIEPDGGLYNRSNYMSWSPDEAEIRLDGSFSPEELVWIAEHMKANGKPKR